MKELKYLLTEFPVNNGKPLYESIRAVAAELVMREPSKFKMLDSVNSALNAIIRDERPFTGEVKSSILALLEGKEVIDEPQGRVLVHRLQGIPTSDRRSMNSGGEGEFSTALSHFEEATDALMVRPVPQPGINVETNPMRVQLFKKLGIYASAVPSTNHSSDDPNYASARLTFGKTPIFRTHNSKLPKPSAVLNC